MSDAMTNRETLRILVLDEEFPYPVNTGKRTRSFNLYRRLSKRFRIRYLAFGHSNSDSADAMRVEGIEPVAVSTQLQRKEGVKFYLRLLENLLSPLPYIVTSHYSKDFEDAVQANVEQFQPHLVLCEWTPYAIYVRSLARTRKLLSTHNIEADIWKRYFDNEPNSLRKWYIGEQWRKVIRFEEQCFGWLDAALAVSELDRLRLNELSPDLETKVVPNGVDLEYFAPTPQPLRRDRIVFTGSMDWRPNQDAARYFASDILPLLNAKTPQIRCTFVGRSPPDDVRSLGSIAGMEITGTVADVRPYIEEASVYVVPLRIGGGTRLKILEALAMGRAVVSTTVGAEGLDLVDGKHILLADDPSAFAERVHQLLQDPVRCQELGAAGRELVEQRYGWDALANCLADFIADLADPRAAAQPLSTLQS